MIPQTLAALLAFLLFIVPGLAFELLRERRRPFIEETAFREASRIGLTSVFFSGGALVIVLGVRLIHSQWFADPHPWLSTGTPYVTDHLGAVVFSVALLLGVALLLAWLTDLAFRTNAPGHIVPGSVWFSVFRKHRPDGAQPWVHMRLSGETDVWGWVGDYTPDQKLDNRELVLEGPNLQYRRKSATSNTVLADWSYFVVRGSEITWIKVQYRKPRPGDPGQNDLVPAKSLASTP